MFAPHWSAFLEGNYIDFDYCLLWCMSPLMVRVQLNCPLCNRRKQKDRLAAVSPKSNQGQKSEPNKSGQSLTRRRFDVAVHESAFGGGFNRSPQHRS
jgi:hypothetical protein